jgi:hypothetical protein
MKETEGVGHKKAMRECYPKHARQGEQQLASVLEAAGLKGAAWEDKERRVYMPERQFAFAPASIPTGKTKANFVACVEAFACGVCDELGAATAQCAACAQLLCPDCASKCPKREACPFALCPNCEDASTCKLFELWHAPAEAKVPGFVVPICTKCPDTVRWCPAHLDWAFLVCDECGEVRCMDHFCDNLMLRPCAHCGFTICESFACQRQSNQSIDLCMICGLFFCSECADERLPRLRRRAGLGILTEQLSVWPAEPGEGDDNNHAGAPAIKTMMARPLCSCWQGDGSSFRCVAF